MNRQAAVLEKARAGAVIRLEELYTALVMDDTSGYPWPTWEELSLARRRWWATSVRARVEGMGLRVETLGWEC